MKAIRQGHGAEEARAELHALAGEAQTSQQCQGAGEAWQCHRALCGTPRLSLQGGTQPEEAPQPFPTKHVCRIPSVLVGTFQLPMIAFLCSSHFKLSLSSLFPHVERTGWKPVTGMAQSHRL